MRHFRISKSGLIVIVLNLLGWGAFGFLARQLYSDSNRVITAYQELYTTTRGKENLSTVSRTLAETAGSQATITTAFLSGDELVAFFEKIEGLSRTAGVVLALDEPKVSSDKTPNLGLTFQAAGSFAGLYRFLAWLENLPYRLVWQSLSFSLKSGTTWTGNFDLTITSYIPSNATK